MWKAEGSRSVTSVEGDPARLCAKKSGGGGPRRLDAVESLQTATSGRGYYGDYMS